MPDFDLNPPARDAHDIRAVNAGSADALEDDDSDFEAEDPPPVREGLPPSFRMRHAPHYVEQLMGGEPIQTVRQIPLAQLHGADVAGERVGHLADSIRDIGLIEPLLVTRRRDGAYDLLAGHQRLAAARQAGLAEVPCLVVEADGAVAAKFRQAASRVAPVAVPVRERAPEPDVPGRCASAFAEISDALAFVNAVMPLAGRAGGFRAQVLADLMRVETERTTALAAAAALLMRTEAPCPEPVDGGALLDAIRPAVCVAARLRGVDVAWQDALPRERQIADRAALSAGWTGIVHAALALAAPGGRLVLKAEAPRVRPAIKLEVTVAGRTFGAEALERLTDPSWREHPGGTAAAIMLAAAGRSAAMHHGRLTLRPCEDGLSIACVMPQPVA